MIRLSKDIISRRSIPTRPAPLAKPRVKTVRRLTHQQKGTELMKDNFKIPARRSWQRCERFHSDAVNIAMDRPTIGDTGSALETSPQ